MWQSVSMDSCDICQCPPRSKRGETAFLDKENVPQSLSPAKNEDLSFYGTTSPSPPRCTGTSPNHCNHGPTSRRPFEDQDPNSRDSGYITNYNGESGKFSSCSTSPLLDSMEDDFFEDIRAIEVVEDALPQNFNKLISAPLACQNRNTSPRDLAIRPLFRRALSFQNEKTASSARHCLFNAADCRPFKRPEPPQEIPSPTSTKKLKVDDEEVRSVPMIARPLLQRHFSATEESIMSAVQRSSVEPDLIGDFSTTFCLPLTQGRHQDLKSITPATLAKLIRGDFDGNVASFKVIDCRYPYEFEGGHIDGALNIFTKEQCLELFNNLQASEAQKRNNILVFHCEFSSERGPNLYRYLREQDRQRNLDTYPSLHYPEVYLLEGGYKNFFEQFRSLCVPIAYTEMLHPKHKNDMLYFRLKSKTWNVDTRQRSKGRGNIKRLDL